MTSLSNSRPQGDLHRERTLQLLTLFEGASDFATTPRRSTKTTKTTKTTAG